MTHRINNWQRPLHVQAVQTTRTIGSHQPFDLHPKRAKPELIDQLVKLMKLPHRPKLLQQVHSNQVIEYVSEPQTDLAYQADACYTRQANTICAVMTADCLPVLLTDSAGSFVAAVHCGWRGLYANLLSQTLNCINSQYPIHAWLGPCIQQQQYEVDADFVTHYLTQHPDSKSAFTAIKGGKSFASLIDLARTQLHHLGVQHVDQSTQCTYLSSAYYSWRENNTTQRMASLTWLTPNQLCQ